MREAVEGKGGHLAGLGGRVWGRRVGHVIESALFYLTPFPPPLCSHLVDHGLHLGQLHLHTALPDLHLALLHSLTLLKHLNLLAAVSGLEGWKGWGAQFDTYGSRRPKRERPADRRGLLGLR